MGHGQGREERMRQMDGDANMQSHAVAYEAEQERMQQMDGKAVIGEAAKKDGEADMQLHGLAWRRRSIGEAEREREWRGRNAVG